jgi:hypothetical protein
LLLDSLVKLQQALGDHLDVAVFTLAVSPSFESFGVVAERWYLELRELGEGGERVHTCSKLRPA